MFKYHFTSIVLAMEDWKITNFLKSFQCAYIVQLYVRTRYVALMMTAIKRHYFASISSTGQNKGNINMCLWFFHAGLWLWGRNCGKCPWHTEGTSDTGQRGSGDTDRAELKGATFDHVFLNSSEQEGSAGTDAQGDLPLPSWWTTVSNYLESQFSRENQTDHKLNTGDQL